MRKTLLVLLLSGCALPAVNITWERVSISEINNQCTMHSGAIGCSKVDKDVAKTGQAASWCRIYTPTRADLEVLAKKRSDKLTPEVLEMAILGHELRHCFEGSYH